MDLKKRFDALDNNLKLDPAERKRAQETHNRLGDLLVDAGVAKRTRLQGSFARHTMRGPKLKDIDKVVELADDLTDSLTKPGGSLHAISLIKDALAPRLPGARFEVKKHALSINLPADGFTFDAVPAFNPEEGSGWIHIADTDDDAWEPSNTYILIDTIAARNQACDGRFVRQVRMVKQAVHHAKLDDVLPGLHIETFTYHAVGAKEEHADAVAATLSKGAQLLHGHYTDPTGWDRISDRLSTKDIATARMGMQRLAAEAATAQQLAASGAETEAAHVWAEIFGEPFPRPAADEKGFLKGLYTGSVVTSRRTPATRAWKPQ
jgi:hypothetical protein